ncbi:hypothetical protein [Cryobacterium cryoconiti]|uniref:Uncharacterized protein n=1 Tax=Cryobacterium cryoconiti TaxID=1259239 RepID=A0A4Y8JTI0_9MICO|nr:hypothetical protein [Cryobacterium cryoconiti]TFD28361.1 hypothetical protein E3T49_11855 [Cryobacterium cryoconiti]
MELGAWDGWASSILSFVAIVIGILIAAKALRQSGQIADSQAKMEKENYLSGRMQGLVEHARATVLESRTIQDLTSPRMSELLSFPEGDVSLIGERRTTVLSALSRLLVQVELLRIYAITMPSVGADSSRARVALSNLMDEGAWLYSEALHLSILAFDDDPDDDVDLSDRHAIVDALLNGSFVNLSTRLLSDCVGRNYDDIPYFNEPGSPWPAVYRRRKEVLLGAVVSKKSGLPGSLVEAGVWSLDHTSDRFQDALMSVLQEWDDLRG